jgi:hypothetical protein
MGNRTVWALSRGFHLLKRQEFVVLLILATVKSLNFTSLLFSSLLFSSFEAGLESYTLVLLGVISSNVLRVLTGGGLATGTDWVTEPLRYLSTNRASGVFSLATAAGLWSTGQDLNSGTLGIDGRDNLHPDSWHIEVVGLRGQARRDRRPTRHSGAALTQFLRPHILE